MGLYLDMDQVRDKQAYNHDAFLNQVPNRKELDEENECATNDNISIDFR